MVLWFVCEQKWNVSSSLDILKSDKSHKFPHVRLYICIYNVDIIKSSENRKNEKKKKPHTHTRPNTISLYKCKNFFISSSFCHWILSHHSLSIDAWCMHIYKWLYFSSLHCYHSVCWFLVFWWFLDIKQQVQQNDQRNEENQMKCVTDVTMNMSVAWAGEYGQRSDFQDQEVKELWEEKIERQTRASIRHRYHSQKVSNRYDKQ